MKMSPLFLLGCLCLCALTTQARAAQDNDPLDDLIESVVRPAETTTPPASSTAKPSTPAVSPAPATSPATNPPKNMPRLGRQRSMTGRQTGAVTDAPATGQARSSTYDTPNMPVVERPTTHQAYRQPIDPNEDIGEVYVNAPDPQAYGAPPRRFGGAFSGVVAPFTRVYRDDSPYGRRVVVEAPFVRVDTMNGSTVVDAPGVHVHTPPTPPRIPRRAWRQYYR